MQDMPDFDTLFPSESQPKRLRDKILSAIDHIGVLGRMRDREKRFIGRWKVAAFVSPVILFSLIMEGDDSFVTSFFDEEFALMVSMVLTVVAPLVWYLKNRKSKRLGSQIIAATIKHESELGVRLLEVGSGIAVIRNYNGIAYTLDPVTLECTRAVSQ